MKKIVLFFFVFVVLAGFAVKESDAGQICWDIDGSAGIKVSVSTPDSLYPKHRLLTGMVYNYSGYFYMPVLGAMEKVSATSSRVGLHGTNNTILFGGYNDCIFDSTIDPTTKNGSFYTDCGNGGYTWSGTITKVSCKSMPSYIVTQTSMSESVESASVESAVGF